MDSESGAEGQAEQEMRGGTTESNPSYEIERAHLSLSIVGHTCSK